jgi:hypothetical protein
VAGLGLALLLAPVAAAQEPAAPAAAEAEREVDEKALAVVQAMTDALGRATSVRFEIETAYDAVQTDGEKLEFGARREVTVRRPDRYRSDVVDRSGSRRTVRYDGQQLVVADPDQKVFASTPRTGNLDSLVDYVTEELGVPMPLSELFSPELPRLLGDEADSGRYVGEATVHGVECAHVAFRNEEVGLQLWIAREGEPLPKRVVITYERAVEEPQFRADFLEWDLSPRTPDWLFAFEPPKDFERISFVPRKRRTAEQEGPR